MGRQAKVILIQEELPALKKVLKRHPLHVRPRIQMLILIKEGHSSSKQALATALGVNPNSTQNWKQRYERGGLEALLSDLRGGYKKSVIDEPTDKAILAKLSDVYNSPRSYKELQQWVSENYVRDINYHTLNKHVKKKHGARIKVARKTHVRKDEQAVATFKKNQ